MTIKIEVSSYEGLIEAIRDYQERSLSESDRIDFWNGLREGYCHNCGCDDPDCQCSNDE